MNTPLRWLILAALPGAAPVSLAAQQTAAERLRVFIDCSWYCDMDFLRTDIAWIDHMRDRADADVHVLVTRQTTGGGGGEFTLEFIGLRDFAGRSDTLRHVATVDDTEDVTRRDLARVIKIGLVPFIALTPQARHVEVTVATPENTAPTPQHDPWNFWAFTIGVNGNAFGESLTNSGSLRGSITANRTTEAWKINTRLSGSYNEQTFEYLVDEELTRTVSIRRSYDASTLIVKSLTPHLSIGGRATASTSTFGNTSLSVSFAPAVEYNFFPYSQSTRRALTLQYTAGARYADYREITEFGHVEETRPIHTLSLGLSTRQPWGSIGIGINGSQYLHDSSKYNAGLGGGVSLRLFRGFSLNLNGGYTRVRDQLSLAARDLTEEEILLRQRQLRTDYSYWGFFGISYRFGSIFNNVVNPRMDPVAGGDVFIAF